MNETENNESKEPITKTKEPENLKGGGTDLPDTKKEAVRCWFTEFSSLRNQVLNYQRMQHNLIWVNVSGIGAIITIYFTYWSRQDFLIFLAIPIFSGLLGLYWVGQGRQTSEVGHYIYERIRPALQRLCQDEEVMVWEEFVRREMGTTFRKYITNILSLRVPRAVGGLTFALPSVAAVVVTITDLRGGLIKCESWEVALIWWVGLMLTVWLWIVGWKLGLHWIAAVPRKGNKAV